MRRLLTDRRGAALIEFGLAVPLLLLLGLGGLEMARYSLAVLRLNQVAQAVADNAGRVRHALDETDVNELMIGGKLIGGSRFAANARIILSDLEQRKTTTGSGGVGPITADNPNGYRQWIRWQRCAGALSRTSSYGVPRDSGGAAVTNLDASGTDHGAVETASTIDGMGPSGSQIAAQGGTAVMVVEVYYTYQPLISLYSFGTTTMHTVQAFNVRQRTDFSVYNANRVSGTGRSDCTLFNANIPT